MFYIYIHSRPDGRPFYVGKGSGKRARTFVKNRNSHYRNIVSKYGKENIQVSIILCTSEAEAFSQEIQLIQSFKALGYELANKTEGGEGPAGMVHTLESRKLMSEFRKGRKFSESHKAAISASHKGRVYPSLSAEHVQKLRNGLRNYVPTPETRALLSANAKGNKYALGLKRGPMPQAQKDKVSASKMGSIPWNKGIKKCL